METIEFKDWQKLDLRIARILEVEDVEGKDKLFKLQVDLGEQKKQLVAGIKPHYSKEELQGKTIIVVNNLAPAKIAGIESQGMLLAASDDSGISILTTDKEVKLGSIVK